jgi:hypothetical protein
MRSDAAPAIQKGSSSVFGVVKCDGSTITCTSGVIAAVGGGGGSGAMTLVGSTCNFNNTTTFCSFTGLTASEYQLRCYGIIAGNSGHVLGTQLATSGPTWKNGSSDYNRQIISVTGARTVANVGTTGNGMAEFLAASSGNNGTSFTMNLHSLSSTTAFKSTEALVSGYNGSSFVTQQESNFLIAAGTDTAAVVGVRFGDTDAAPANIVKGSCSLYAIAN